MTAPDLPAPLVPAEVDLRDFQFTPIYRGRLFGSSFHARVSDAGWRAAVTLWLKSWDQVPAGTLPSDEIELCRLAEFARDVKAWRKVASEALHGWFECSDGRLHHRTVAEGIMDAWHRKMAQRARTEEARKAKLAKRQSQTQGAVPTDPVTGSVTEPVAAHVTGSKGQGQGQGHIPPEPPSGSPSPEPSGRRGGQERRKAKPTGELCPEDFTPSPSHYDKAAEWGRARAWVDDQAERMKAWSRANANRDTAWKSNWSQALHNWLRDHRDDGRALVVAGSRGQGPPGGAVAPARSTSGPSSARAGISAALGSYRGELL